MKQGFLWYDNSSRSLQAKLQEAADRYRHKFGKDPTTCYVNPVHLSEVNGDLDLKITGAASILPNYIWLELAEP